MSMHLGYALSSAIFLSIFVVMVAVQLAADTYRPFLYWSVIVATTTAGTTMADFADRSLHIGYVGGSLVLLASLLAVLGLWRLSLGSVSVDRIISRKAEAFYWATILSRTPSGRLSAIFSPTTLAWGTQGLRSFLAPSWRWWRWPIFGRIFRALGCFGWRLF